MIVLLQEQEAWSLMMLVSAVAIDNSGITEEGKEAIRRWRSERGEKSPALEDLTDALNAAMNAHIDTKFTRRRKVRGKRAETVRT